MEISNVIRRQLTEIYSYKVSADRIDGFANSLEEIIADEKHELKEVVYLTDDFEGDVCEVDNFKMVFRIVLTLMTVCKENAERLYEFLGCCKNEDAYCALYRDYWDFLTESQKSELDRCDCFQGNAFCARWKERRANMVLWKRDDVDKEAVKESVSKAYKVAKPENIRGYDGYFSFNFGDIYIAKEIKNLLNDLKFKHTIDDCLTRFRSFDYGNITKDEKSLNDENRLFFGINYQLVGKYETEYGDIKIEVPDYETTEISVYKENAS